MVQQLFQRKVERPVDDQSQRPVGVVLADVDDRLEEIGVGQRRHGDQELVGQIGGLGHRHSIGIRSGLDKSPVGQAGR